VKAGIGLGSNLGDRLQHLQHAKACLLSLSSAQWHCASPVYETAPVDCPAGSATFLNAVVEIEFAGTASALLEMLLAYEIAQGRDRSAGPNAPRTIDLDILYFGEQELRTPDLVIPHPRIATRGFVLVPLSTICPDRIIKGTGRTVRQLLQKLPADDVRFVQQNW
jgi:2-amino-4-hydroxy-6-hydroxymethyldihydropteridine diphosphokinase